MTMTMTMTLPRQLLIAKGAAIATTAAIAATKTMTDRTRGKVVRGSRRATTGYFWTSNRCRYRSCVASEPVNRGGSEVPRELWSSSLPTAREPARQGTATFRHDKVQFWRGEEMEGRKAVHAFCDGQQVPMDETT